MSKTPSVVPTPMPDFSPGVRPPAVAFGTGAAEANSSELDDWRDAEEANREKLSTGVGIAAGSTNV